ncbi:MAG: hypothetical protein WKF89_02385 [Chitinophagaceae bacterium]
MPHITFIHGIANKPKEDQLLKLWKESLLQDFLGNGDGIDLDNSGVTTSMIYWADLLYDSALEEGVFESAEGFENGETVAVKDNADPDMAWRGELKGDEKETVDALAAKLSFDVLVNDDFQPPNAEIANTLERIPLPWFVKRRMMKWLLRDVHHYLFNYESAPRPGERFMVQEEIRRRVLEKLKAGSELPGPHIVISHSMGTVISYDCLKRVPECPSIDGLMTIGSPLGLDEIQDNFSPEWTREDGFPGKLNGQWINVYDMLDPVTGFDSNISNDYKKGGAEIIEVINEQNWGAWRHNITNYLSGPKLRVAINKLLNRNTIL